MAGWFAKAKASLGAPVDVPSPFSLECSCGEPVTGERTTQAQFLPCPVCRRKIFVLPRDPYPAVERPTPRNQPPPFREPLDEGDLSIPSSSPSRKDMNPSPDGSSGRKSRADRKSRGKPASKTPAQVAVPSFQPPARKLTLGPVHFVSVGILTVLIASGVYLWHRAAIDHARSIVDAASETGIDALLHRDFPTAHAQLSEVRSALDLLGKQDEAAGRLRAYAAEAEAANGMLNESLIDVLKPLLSGPSSEQAWEQDVRSAMGERWLILEAAVVSPSPAQQDTDSLLLDVPLMIEGKPVLVVITGASRELREAGSPLILAAPVKSLRWNDGRTELTLSLDGGKAFLWKHEDSLEATGLLNPDPAAAAVQRDALRRQGGTVTAPPASSPAESPPANGQTSLLREGLRDDEGRTA